MRVHNSLAKELVTVSANSVERRRAEALNIFDVCNESMIVTRRPALGRLLPVVSTSRPVISYRNDLQLTPAPARWAASPRNSGWPWPHSSTSQSGGIRGDVESTIAAQLKPQGKALQSAQ